MPECIGFGTRLTGEMCLLGRAVQSKTVSQMRNEIIKCLEAENKMCELLTQIEVNELRKESMVCIMAFIPCIMHMETRIVIKILTLSLIEGLSSAQGEHLHPIEYTECRTAKKHEDKYISTIEDIINKTIIDNTNCLAQ